MCAAVVQVSSLPFAVVFGSLWLKIDNVNTATAVHSFHCASQSIDPDVIVAASVRGRGIPSILPTIGILKLAGPSISTAPLVQLCTECSRCVFTGFPVSI